MTMDLWILDDIYRFMDFGWHYDNDKNDIYGFWMILWILDLVTSSGNHHESSWDIKPWIKTMNNR